MTVPTSPLIGLTVRCDAGRRFKSIENLDWNDIPPLAVLTGRNGSGKSQLLELIAHKVTEAGDPRFKGIHVTFSGCSYGPESIAYLPSRWEIQSGVSVGIPKLLEARTAAQQLMTTSRQSELKSRIWAARLRKEFKEKAIDLPDDQSFMLDDNDVVTGLAHLFVAHRLRIAEALLNGESQEDIKQRFGEPPWDVVNKSLRVADFPYEVALPTKTRLDENYRLEFVDRASGVRVAPGELSSGEKMLLNLILWLFNSERNGKLPKLFLLDEPDANLHPTLTRQFFAVIKDVLIERHGARVIMTTHSPSTVALAPAESLFEMSRTSPRIKRASSQSATVSLLTSGFVIVSPSTRIVLVEDETDVRFYETVRAVLTDYGPSRDPRAIDPVPSILFQPASRGSGSTKVGGGCSAVQAWVKKFDQAPLDDLVRGAIDRDVANTGSARVQVLSRYSIENYLLDPLVVFGLLSSAGKAPTVPGVSISTGDEHRIRTLPQSSLNSIISAVALAVETHLTPSLNSSERDPRTITFTNGTQATYPAWMIDRRGHDLLAPFQAAFGGSSMITPPRLEKSFQLVRLIPVDLADLFVALQRPV